MLNKTKIKKILKEKGLSFNGKWRRPVCPGGFKSTGGYRLADRVGWWDLGRSCGDALFNLAIHDFVDWDAVEMLEQEGVRVAPYNRLPYVSHETAKRLGFSNYVPLGAYNSIEEPETVSITEFIK